MNKCINNYHNQNNETWLKSLSKSNPSSDINLTMDHFPTVSKPHFLSQYISLWLQEFIINVIIKYALIFLLWGVSILCNPYNYFEDHSGCNIYEPFHLLILMNSFLGWIPQSVFSSGVFLCCFPSIKLILKMILNIVILTMKWTLRPQLRTTTVIRMTKIARPSEDIKNFKL